MLKLCRTFLALTVSWPTAATAQQLLLAEGDDPDDLTIRVVDESQPLDPGTILLRSADLLPLEVSAMTAQRGVRSDLSRRIDRNGLSRVELPGGGRVFHYSAEGDVHGLLLVRPDGSPLVLMELPGHGGDSPFRMPIGVAPDGGHAAVVTEDWRLFAVRLDGGSYPSTGSPSRPIRVQGKPIAESLMPGSGVLFFQTEGDRLWRCPLADGGKPEEVTPSPESPSELRQEMAISEDGGTLAFLFGRDDDELRAWVLGETGTARAVPLPPSRYDDPGYGDEGGPRLLLNGDGSRLLLRDDGVMDGELYLVDTARPMSVLNFTGNDFFGPYIGVGILPVFSAQILILGVARDEEADVFAVQTSEPQVTNLTMTNGNLTPPFGLGSLRMQQSILLASGSGLIAASDAGGPVDLLRVTPSPGSSVTVASDLSGPAAAGDALDGAHDYLAPAAAGDVFLSGVDGSALLRSSPGLALSIDVVARARVFRVFVVRAGDDCVPVLHTAGGDLLMLAPQRCPVVPILSRSGALLLNGQSLMLISPSGAVSIPRTTELRFVLSGSGA